MNKLLGIFTKMCLGWFELVTRYWKVFVGLVYNPKLNLSNNSSSEISRSKNCILSLFTIFSFKLSKIYKKLEDKRSYLSNKKISSMNRL